MPPGLYCTPQCANAYTNAPALYSVGNRHFVRNCPDACIVLRTLPALLRKCPHACTALRIRLSGQVASEDLTADWKSGTMALLPPSTRAFRAKHLFSSQSSEIRRHEYSQKDLDRVLAIGNVPMAKIWMSAGNSWRTISILLTLGLPSDRMGTQPTVALNYSLPRPDPCFEPSNTTCTATFLSLHSASRDPFRRTY